MPKGTSGFPLLIAQILRVKKDATVDGSAVVTGNLTVTGTLTNGAYTSTATDIDAGASGTVGTVDIFPTTASKGKIQITAADSAGNTTTTIVNASQAGARTYTIPDAGASASFLMTAGAQTATGVKTFSDGIVVDAGEFTIGATAVTATAAELNKATGLAATAYHSVAELRSFTETTGAGTYTGSVTVPIGAIITDIKVWSTVLWTATTSALMDVGDAVDPDGWYTQIDLKATDLLVNEEINFAQLGGKQGAYIVAATGQRSTAYSALARVISGIIITVGAAGLAGRTFLSVHYVLPIATAAVKS